MRRTAGIVLGMILVSGLIGACSSSDTGSGDGSTAAVDAPEEARPAHFGADQKEADLGGNDSYAYDSGSASGQAGGATSDQAFGAPAPKVGRSLLSTPQLGPSVIKTADIEVEVPRGDFQDALNQSIGVAGRYGGFVVSTTIDDADKRSGMVVLRVPAQDFEEVLSSLEGLGELQNEIVSGRDVSQEFIDLDARIRNYESQEAVLLRLMARTNTINETIRVQHELQSIRLEIERLKGRLRFLRNQAAMSTISMSLIETGVVRTDPPKIGVLGRAWDRAISGALAVVAAVIVGAGVLFPIALMIALGLLVLRLLRPRFGSAT